MLVKYEKRKLNKKKKHYFLCSSISLVDQILPRNNKFYKNFASQRKQTTILLFF